MKFCAIISLALLAISLAAGKLITSTHNDILVADVNGLSGKYSSISLTFPIYSTYLGGSGNDGGGIAAIDEFGRTYIVGASKSYDFPKSVDAFQPFLAGEYDLYITRLSKDGNHVEYSSLFGGNQDDLACGTNLDTDNNLIIAGTTYSVDFPLTENAIERRFNGSAMGFVSKFDSSGKLIFSTYLGGEWHEQLFGMTVDDEGSIYVTGLTKSRLLPVTPGALQSQFRGGSNDAFVMKIDSSCSRIIYCTYFGAGGFDEAYTIKVNKKGEAIIAGGTNSQNLPTTPGVVFGKAPWGGMDGFIVKISADGKRIVQCTYLGGTRNWDFIEAIDLDEDENIYCTGRTLSVDFPVTAGAFQTEFPYNQISIAYSAFSTKLAPYMDSIIFSTYLGGTKTEWPNKIYAYNDNIVIIGSTESDDYPTTPNAIQTTLKGTEDVFLTILNHDGTELVYSTFYGGSGYEAGSGIVLDFDSSIIIGLNTQSPDFPITPNALQPQFGGGTSDAGIVKISLKDIITSTSLPLPIPSSMALGQSYPNPAISGNMVTMPYTVAQRGHGSIIVYNGTGQQVASYPISHNAPGNYTKSIILPVLSKGLYFYTLDYNGKRETRKLVVEW